MSSDEAMTRGDNGLPKKRPRLEDSVVSKKRQKRQQGESDSDDDSEGSIAYFETCEMCGNQWDGNAQCKCQMYGTPSDHLFIDEDDADDRPAAVDGGEDEDSGISLGEHDSEDDEEEDSCAVTKTLSVTMTLKIDGKKRGESTMDQLAKMLILRVSSPIANDDGGDGSSSLSVQVNRVEIQGCYEYHV